MPPAIGPKIKPMPLQDWARLIRVAPYSSAPKTVAYGLAMVSRKVRPAAIAQTPTKNAQKDPMWVAGINQNPPNATNKRPAMMPPL